RHAPCGSVPSPPASGRHDERRHAGTTEPATAQARFSCKDRKCVTIYEKRASDARQPQQFGQVNQGDTAMLFFSEGLTFRNFLADAFAVFMFVLWFWLLIVVIGDLFRRHDVSGWVKAIWVIALIVFPYLGIFAYMITQSRGMAERNTQQVQQARDELRRVVGFSVADEIEKLDRLRKSGTITDQEYKRLRAKLVA